MNQTPSLQLENIVKEFVPGQRAVNDVSLDIKSGETTAIIGPNGAGKSTVFAIAAGEFPPTVGKVFFEGQDITKTSSSERARMGISRTFQVARVFANLSVRMNLSLAAAASRTEVLKVFRSRSANELFNEDVERSLVETNLENRGNLTAGLLAQGDRKRLELAMAVSQNPRLLLMDEPTAGMATEDVLRTTEILLGLKVSRPEMTTIITAHDMGVVFAIADRVVVLGSGEVQVDGTPEEVRAHPTTKTIYLGRDT